jgi:hypothetical protein
MGPAAGLAACRSVAGRPVGRSPVGDQRDLLPDAHRVPVAGLAGGVRDWKTVCNRHRRWSGDGTWEQIRDRLRAECDEAEGKDWTSARIPPWSARTSTLPAPAAPCLRTWSQGAAANDRKSGREAIGRSRGGLSTKIHLAADRRCRAAARRTGSRAPKHPDTLRTGDQLSRLTRRRISHAARAHISHCL